MGSTPRLSLVIPVLDQAAYIEDMINDVRNQTYEDFEAIFVDGDSTDGTADIIRKHAAGDERIKLFVYKKPGVSAARNFGIARAKGKYIMFPDGDDRLDEDYLITLMRSVADSRRTTPQGYERMPVQLGFCGYDIFEGEDVLFETPESGIRVLDKADMLCRLFYMGNYQGYVWNKIFRRDIIEKYHIRFDEKCFYREDQLFLVRYIMKADAVRMDPARVYHYRIHGGSAMGELRNKKKSGRVRRRQITNLTALIKMHRALWGYPDARWLCRQSFYYEFKEYFGR